MNLNRARRLSYAALVLSLLGVLVPVILLIHFSRPFADDFSFANSAREQGLFGAIHHQYLTWQGRWLGNGFSFAADRIGSPRAVYSLLLYLVLASLFASIVVLTRTLFASISVRMAAGWASCLLCFYFSRMPAQGETLYWLTGAFENHLSIALMIFCFAALLARGRKQNRPSRWEYLVFPVLFAIVVGGHELYGVICFILLSAGTYVMFRTNSPRVGLWAGCVLGAAIGLAVVVLSPGNAFRFRYFPNHGKIGPTVKSALSEALVFEPYVLDVGLWLAGLLFISSARVSAIEPTWRIFQLKRPLAFAIVVAAALAAAALLAPAWGMGEAMPVRTQDACLLLLILGWFALIYISYWQLGRIGWLGAPPATVPDREVRRPILDWLPAVLGIAILGGPNVIVALHDSVTSGRHFSQAMDGRVASLDAAVRQSTQSDVLLPPILKPPKSFAYTMDIEPDATNWKNQAVARFYGVRSVRTGAPVAGSASNPLQH